MSLKMTGVSREELASLAKDFQLQPHFTEESCYIATGPDHEILAVLQPTGFFDVQLLGKVQAEQSVNETIRIFQQFVAQRDQGGAA